MLRIGLTGGIGSGKSTVSNKFKSYYNVPVIDADEINHSLLISGSPAFNEIIDLFGSDALLASGEIDRKYLRDKIFSDTDLKKKLENILHPKIRAEISHLASSLTTDYCLIVIPLLIESQLQSIVDRILVIDASSDTQIQRVTHRDHCNEAHVKIIISSQADAEERLKFADDIVNNNGNFTELDEQIEKLHKKYLTLSQQP
ncbi:MAG: dephospho-CoA kinase [Pseudomonadota bacterium]